MATVKSKLQGWAARLAAARSALHEVNDLDAELRAAHDGLLKERRRIANASPPLEEVLATMEAAVDAAAQRWAAEHGSSLLRSFGPGLRLKADGSLVPERPGFPLYFATNPFTFNDLCGLAPAAVKSRLHQIFAGLAYAPGPATADRERMLAEVDARIAETEREHEALVVEAAALEPPVLLALLPAVAERREREQRRAELQAEEAAARKRAQDAANQAAIEAASQSRAVRSPYLERGR